MQFSVQQIALFRNRHDARHTSKLAGPENSISFALSKRALVRKQKERKKETERKVENEGEEKKDHCRADTKNSCYFYNITHKHYSA